MQKDFRLGAICESCKQTCLVPIPGTQLATAVRDPVIVFRELPYHDRMSIARFWTRHESLGHELRPTVCEVTVLPEA